MMMTILCRTFRSWQTKINLSLSLHQDTRSEKSLKLFLINSGMVNIFNPLKDLQDKQLKN